jgi:hypothetical protein
MFGAGETRTPPTGRPAVLRQDRLNNRTGTSLTLHRYLLARSNPA